MTDNTHRKGLWDEAEDDLLIKKVGEYGCNWAKIANFISGRSMDELYARYITLETFAQRIIQNKRKLKRNHFENELIVKAEQPPPSKHRRTGSITDISSSVQISPGYSPPYPNKIFQHVLRNDTNQHIISAREHHRLKEKQEILALVQSLKNSPITEPPDTLAKSRVTVVDIDIINPPLTVIKRQAHSSDSSSSSSSDSDSENEMENEQIVIPKFHEVRSIQALPRKFWIEFQSGYLGLKYLEERKSINEKVIKLEEQRRKLDKIRIPYVSPPSSTTSYTPTKLPPSLLSNHHKQQQQQQQQQQSPLTSSSQSLIPVTGRKRAYRKKKDNDEDEDAIIENVKKETIAIKSLINENDQLYGNIMFSTCVFNALGKNDEVVNMINGKGLRYLLSNSEKKICCLCRTDGDNLQLCCKCKRYYHSTCILCEGEEYNYKNKNNWKCFLCEPLIFKNIIFRLKEMINLNNILNMSKDTIIPNNYHSESSNNESSGSDSDSINNANSIIDDEIDDDEDEDDDDEDNKIITINKHRKQQQHNNNNKHHNHHHINQFIINNSNRNKENSIDDDDDDMDIDVDSYYLWTGLEYTKCKIPIDYISDELLINFTDQKNENIKRLKHKFNSSVHRIGLQQFVNMSKRGEELMNNVINEGEYYHYDFIKKNIFFSTTFPIPDELLKIYPLSSNDYYIHFGVLLQSLYKDLYTLIRDIYPEILLESVKNEVLVKKDDKKLPDDGYGGGSRAWIFQANPSYYDIDASLKKLKEMTWFVKQSRNYIHIGDMVFIWKSGPYGGLVAIGTIKSEPAIIKECKAMKPYYQSQEFFTKIDYRCWIDIDCVLPTCISRDVFIGNDATRDITIFRAPIATNFKLTASQANGILDVTRRVVGDLEDLPCNIDTSKKVTPKPSINPDNNKDTKKHNITYMLDIQDYCHICGKDNDDSHIILCDKCDRGFHIYCLNPKLNDIPNGEWICPICKLKKKRRYIRGVNCEICGEVCNSSEDISKSKSCIICHKLYHINCYKANTNLNLPEWKCTFCEGYQKKKYHLEKDDEWCRTCLSKSPENDLFRCSCCEIVRHKSCPDQFNNKVGYESFQDYSFCYSCYDIYFRDTLCKPFTRLHIFHQEACSLIHSLLNQLIKQIIQKLNSVNETEFDDAVYSESTRINLLYKLIAYILTNFLLSIK